MISAKSLFSHGPGPSSLFSVHPHRIVGDFKDENHDSTTIQVTLYGSMAQKCDENYTKQALKMAISPLVGKILLEPDNPEKKGYIMKLEAFGKKKVLNNERVVYLTKLGEAGTLKDDALNIFSSKDILQWTYDNGRSIWEFAKETGSSNIEEFMEYKWQIMEKSIASGLKAEGGIPHTDGLYRKSSLFEARAMQNRGFVQDISKCLSYSAAVIEESACGKTIVAAPTAETCGVIPGAFKGIQEAYKISSTRIIRGLLTAGVIGKLLYRDLMDGNFFKELDIATAMASAGVTQIMGGSPNQVLAAAALALKNGFANNENATLEDKIEMNIISSVRATDIATMAIVSDNNLSREIEYLNYLTRGNQVVTS